MKQLDERFEELFQEANASGRRTQYLLTHIRYDFGFKSTSAVFDSYHEWLQANKLGIYA